MHTQLSGIPPSTTCWHFVQVLVNHRWPCHAKNRSQHWENWRLYGSRFRHMPCSPVNYFMLLWFRFVQKGLFKSLFKCKSVKSNDKVHQSGLSKQWPLSMQSVSLYSAVLWPMCFAQTTYSHSLKTNGPAVTKVIDTYHEYISKENWMPNTVAYEKNNFIDIFWVNFVEEKRLNFKMSYLLF